MLERPELTFPEDVGCFVADTYRAASTVLEYGSGGSTVLAAEMPSLRCFSVESDRQWAEGLREWLDGNVPRHLVEIHYCNIGRTGAWGWPDPPRRLMAPWYAQYPAAVWRRPDFMHPDVVLIDGRFRVGCFLTVMSRIQRPVTVLFDDYAERTPYHVVEDFFQPVRFVGRMAEFHVEPRRMSVIEWFRHLRRRLSPL